MHPIREIDALLLLALAVASKRRPAELVEIVAATDMLDGEIPTSFKLSDTFFRLSKHGLIADIEGGFTLTPAAETMLAGLPRKAETEQRVEYINELLAAHQIAEELEPIVLTSEQLGAAILAHRSFKKSSGRNMAMPKSKTDEINYKRAHQWRPGLRKSSTGKRK